MASSVTTDSVAKTQHIKKITCTWLSHTDGVVTAAAVDTVINGTLIAACFRPHATAATNGHIVTLTNEDGATLFTQTVTTTATTYFNNTVGTDGTGYSGGKPVFSTIKIGVTGAGSGKKGYVDLYYV